MVESPGILSGFGASHSLGISRLLEKTGFADRVDESPETPMALDQ